MEQIKIQKEFWDKIVSGEKQYEFRKLSKGLISGTYEFVSIELGKELFDSGEIRLGRPLMVKRPKEIFGTAHLKPIDINPIVQAIYGEYSGTKDTNNGVIKYLFANKDMFEFYEEDMGELYYQEGKYSFDKATYDFVKENYIDKDIEFMVYEISDVKENK